MKKQIQKAIVVLVIIILAITVAGVTGLSFAAWPTFWPDHQLSITPQCIEFLNGMRKKPKFQKDTEAQYPGATSEAVRIDADARLNALLDSLINGLPKNQRKAFVIKQFKETLGQFEKFDSEEKDRLLLYLEDIMDEVGIRNSNELFNVWRYGFPYGLILRST